ncbi:response regulator transcription factor [Brevibacillus sp. RS1.1]|uniref:response regulator transcription factor n=1 Tax=Brevibacillus sp. RS1.1 TaxID=2738982 RepID=UPI00156BBCD0|nr:response regulator transcription factor [Brevibacillus sp. RS1.1]NRR05257.1 response regulator transcription factor [Brevibacillus sp. RS1.1]
MLILAVEDEKALLQTIAGVLADEGYQVDRADRGDDGLLLAERGIYDLLVLDIMMPGMDGLSLVRTLRTKGIMTPVLFLTAKDSVESRVEGLDAGADDYLVKPFAAEELTARVRALLRRQGKQNTEGELAYGPLSLKINEYDGFVDDEPMKLTTKEYELLKYFLQNREQILTRQQIFDRVWGIDSEANYGVVDLYVHYLRKKLGAYEGFIRTIRNVGYILKKEKNDV